MATKYNILVFPCGSEIGLEIYRSLQHSIHVNLIGANSLDDHGRFVYENYIPDTPFYNHPNFIPFLKEVIEKYSIDAIYPAMDAVIAKLSEFESELDCKIIGSPLATNQICLSKKKTYKVLNQLINIPHFYSDLKEVEEYPVFMKPEVGYGARGAKLVHNFNQGMEHLQSFPTSIILGNLPGKEYTVDCFTNKKRDLLFSMPRLRRRINNGISVNTVPVKDRLSEFRQMAEIINERIDFRGAWFFQVKENSKGELYLLEVASRLGGSSSLFRNIGVNFALMTIFDAFGHDVKIFYNDYNIEMDRGLDGKYKIDIQFQKVYVDLDDCLIFDNKVNCKLVSLLYQFLNEGKELILITKHETDVNQTLKKYRLIGIFDQIIHLDKTQFKYQFMEKRGSIFIDDSFAERFQVHEKLGIPVFAIDNIECLLR